MTKATALLAWAPGLGFGLPCIYASWHFANRGQIWTFLGYPTYGEGLFETIGIKTSMPLLVSFLLVCVAELVVGRMLWRNRRAGLVCALALLPIELVFWTGFSLPFGPLLGLARTALLLMPLVVGALAAPWPSGWHSAIALGPPTHGLASTAIRAALPNWSDPWLVSTAKRSCIHRSPISLAPCPT